MIINKNIGEWMEEDTTLLQDVAYEFYCQYRKNKLPENITTQYVVARFPDIYKKFYKLAEKRIRKEKLDKINDKENR